MKYKVREGKEVQVYKKIPKGWQVLKGTLTQPVGTVWISNNEPIFKKGKDGKLQKNPKRKQALCVQNEELMITRIAEKRRYRFSDAKDFIADKETEKRIRAEMNRQTRAQKQWEKEQDKLSKNSPMKETSKSKKTSNIKNSRKGKK